MVTETPDAGNNSPTYPILRVERGIERSIVMSTVADCLPIWIERHKQFVLFQMRTNSDPLEWKYKRNTDLIGALAWYNEEKSNPCFFDPTGKIRGTFLVTDAWTVHHPYGLTLREQNHELTRIPDQYFTTANMEDILRGFQMNFFESDERFYVPHNGAFISRQKSRKTSLGEILEQYAPQAKSSTSGNQL